MTSTLTSGPSCSALCDVAELVRGDVGSPRCFFVGLGSTILILFFASSQPVLWSLKKCISQSRSKEKKRLWKLCFDEMTSHFLIILNARSTVSPLLGEKLACHFLPNYYDYADQSVCGLYIKLRSQHNNEKLIGEYFWGPCRFCDDCA